MRVLWFTTSPSLGADFLNHIELGCSWIQSLEDKLVKENDLQLGIAFLWKGIEDSPFMKNGTRYYPISNQKISGKLKKLYSRWSHKVISEENVHSYLKVIEEFAPDIIHIFGTENDYGKLISKINIPCVIHIQGNLIVYGHKWYSGFKENELFKYSRKWSILKGYGFYHDYVVNKKSAEREMEIFKECKYFMGRTDWDKRLCSVFSPGSQYFHCDEIMRSGFYLHKWLYHERQIDYSIITTIRGNIYKGLETIFESKKILDKIVKDCKVTWKVAGIKEEDELSYLIERKYKDRFNRNGIQLLGPLQENELISEMIKADLFVHPSHIDNSPNSVCEAMLLGMPVIATYAGGIPSMLSDRKEGLLVQDGDPYALAGAIIELINDNKIANTLGSNARDRALKRNDPERIVNTVLDIYSSVLGEK